MKICEQIHEATKKLLMEYNYNIIDFYIEEHTYSINYVIDTDIMTIDLVKYDYSENKDNLFDEINIYNNKNDTIFTTKYEDIPEEFCENKIINLIKNKIDFYYKSSKV